MLREEPKIQRLLIYRTQSRLQDPDAIIDRTPLPFLMFMLSFSIIIISLYNKFRKMNLPNILR